MSNPCRLLSIAGVLCAAVVFADAKDGQALAPGQALSVRVYSQVGVSAATVKCAMAETSRLFGTAGIRIAWEMPSIAAPEDRGTDMTASGARQPDHRGYIVVRLVQNMPATVLPGALGYALPFAHTGAHVTIFYNRVEPLSGEVNAPAYVILGHAMAHEVGHVLLGSPDHSKGGLMQSHWTAGSWRLASAGLLTFGREEAAQIRLGLRRIQASQVIRQG